MGGSNSSSNSSSSKSSNSISKSSNSSGSGAKVGSEWASKIYFDPEADKDSGESYNIEDDELISKLTELVDADEHIIKVSAYKVKLSGLQLTSFIMYHMFIVFETHDWWWSIEKHSDGITIQRSRQLSAVKERYRQGERHSSLSFIKQDDGKKSVKDLIEWLYLEDELNKDYNWVTSNCKHFGKAVFNHVASKECLCWYNGAFS